MGFCSLYKSGRECTNKSVIHSDHLPRIRAATCKFYKLRCTWNHTGFRKFDFSFVVPTNSVMSAQINAWQAIEALPKAYIMPCNWYKMDSADYIGYCTLVSAGFLYGTQKCSGFTNNSMPATIFKVLRQLLYKTQNELYLGDKSPEFVCKRGLGTKKKIYSA